MMKDRVVWGGCLLLLATGILIGKMTAPDAFFEVDNIHEAFEIAGAIATILAVALAVLTMSDWRRQAKAESDHELARQVVVLLRKYRDETVKTWHYAESSIAQIEGNTWVGEGGSDNYLYQTYQRQLDNMKSLRADLAPLEIECAEVWGGLFSTHFSKLYLLDDLLSELVDIYLRLLVRGVWDPRAEIEMESAAQRWLTIKDLGFQDFKNAEAQIDKVFNPLRDAARQRLIKA
ncbi:hypothetical protein LU676_14030 [Pseudomonas alloputida]|uniref:hypothetical protein n=1 Tax=Pseudomonas alloputida TaxID=1940621 RepID=UPI001E39CC35|nr:hypothetical protein [Pseudomonas alloputida]MCE0903872.1 hypothetical protein [Pseudomonas alloputida]